MSSPWPFTQWGLEIVGPFPKAVGNKRYLLVGTDYFNKWVEAQPLANIRDADAKKLIWRNIVTRFEVPRTLISDNGLLFDNKALTSHEKGLRTSKPSSPSEESDSRILRVYCGVKELNSPGPFHTGPKTHAEEEETPKDEQRESLSCQETSPRTILSSANQNHKKEWWHAFKDNLPGHPKQKGLTQWASHGSMVEE